MPASVPKTSFAPVGGDAPFFGAAGLVAFTLIELLMVIAIIAILAALLFPSLSRAKSKGQQVACLNHLKQMALGFHLYTADNDGKLPENFPANYKSTNSWVSGSMKVAEQSTNQVLIRAGRLFPYVGHPSVYRCPSDFSQTANVPRARSYSMNSWIGSRHMETSGRVNSYRTFVRESELSAARPSNLWLMLDEHEWSIDDGWFLVTMDDSRPFESFPTTRHGRAYALNFADGHVERYALLDGGSRFSELPGLQIRSSNLDWQRLKQVTTVR